MYFNSLKLFKSFDKRTKFFGSKIMCLNQANDYFFDLVIVSLEIL